MSRTKAWGWFALRRSIQLTSLTFVVYAAVSMHWRNFKVAHNQPRLVELMTGSEFNAWLYEVNEDALSLFGEPLAVSDGMLGGPWAADVGGISFVDPFAVLTVAAGGVVPSMAMMLGALFPLALAAVLGKVFCSFLCPARLAFEVGSGIRRGLERLGIPLLQIRLPRMGLWVGLGAVLAAASAGPAVMVFALPYLALHMSISAWFTAGVVFITAVWFGAVWLFDLFIAPGQVCHSLCPTGALLETFGRAPVLALAKVEQGCPPSCDLCQRACPYGLYPGRETHRPACDSCGRCTLACPSNKLSTRLVRPGAMVALLLALSMPAEAHHNKGLPHYGYYDNYPQVPTEEFIDEVGRWEVGAVFFNFQGMDRRSSDTPEDVRIFAYIYDLEDDRGYKGELTLHLYDSEGNRLETYDRLQSDQEGVYVLRQTMPGSSDYVLVFDFEKGGERFEVPLDFSIDLSVDQVPWGLVAAGGFGLFGLFSIAAVGRKNRAARRAAPAGGGHGS